MRTIKFRMIPEQSAGNRLEVETECMVDSAEEAYTEGKRSYELVISFLNGYTDGDDDEVQGD